MEETRKKQAAVIRCAVKLKNSDERKALAKQLIWWRKNRKPLETEATDNAKLAV